MSKSTAALTWTTTPIVRWSSDSPRCPSDQNACPPEELTAKDVIIPLPRFEHLEPERRDAILRATAQELAVHGPQGASVNRILSASDLSKGALYYYFADRDDLLATTIRVHLEQVLAAMGWPEPVADATAYWKDWSERYARMLGFLAADPDLAGVLRIVVRAREGAEASVPMAEFNALVGGWLTRMLEIGTQVGAVRDDLPDGLLHQMVFGLLEGQDRWLGDRGNELSDEERDGLPNLLIGLLRRLVQA